VEQFAISAIWLSKTPRVFGFVIMMAGDIFVDDFCKPDEINVPCLLEGIASTDNRKSQRSLDWCQCAESGINIFFGDCP
jgi:hypothetical protein